MFHCIHICMIAQLDCQQDGSKRTDSKHLFSASNLLKYLKFQTRNVISFFYSLPASLRPIDSNQISDFISDHTAGLYNFSFC